ncbi:hypothetical protein [Paenarthrobacter sp. YJN-5]|uniref:hypothetical protein n=1 Tax=Paenarthrobacter sp. YJN-5 TaxID=2735316 RepID=UPI001878D531|nr:hypothetical protein [Paenarthrobacter sp. YJN-5]QOT19628.1 hypothetical protein HMI59_23735 [Paenarthrobacter sp. YJN-5]
MESTVTVSTDLEAVTDLVLKRQLIGVERDHVMALVKMALDCASEAAGPVDPVYRPRVRRISAVIKAVDLYPTAHGFCDHISYSCGGKAPRGSAFGPPRNDPSPTALTRQLHALVGHDIALWVTDDPFFAFPTIVQFNDLGKAS